MNCKNHCNAKCKMLGGLEQKIMDVLWASAEALKPSDILAKIPQKLAYTTITTVLKRMVNKKLVSRYAKRNIYYYQAAIDKATFAKDCLDDLFVRLFESYGLDVADSYRRVSQELRFS